MLQRRPLSVLAVVAVLGGTPAMAPDATASVLVVGDSLGVGTEGPLRAALSDVAIEFDNRNGRTSPEGVSILSERLRPEHDTVVFDLGTNDGNTAVAVTAGSLAAARELAAGRCLVIATLNRPPLAGIPIDAQNSMIRRFAAETPNAVLVDWYDAAASTDGALRPDGVHATAAGYGLRGALFADAISGCLDGGGGGAVGQGASAAAGQPASPADRPSRRRLRSASPPVRPLELRLVDALARRLTADRGPLHLAAKAASAVATSGTTVRDALTPRGPEPILGADSARPAAE